MEQAGHVIEVIWTWFGANTPYRLMLFAMVLDVVSGLIKAGIQRKLSSEVSGRGMLTKCGMVVLVLLAKSFETSVDTPLGSFAASAIAIHEAISVIENLAQSGIWVPEVIRRYFARLHDEEAKR